MCHLPTATAIVSNFPAKLHFTLNDLKRDGLEHIASWQQHGRCFIVRNPKEFEKTILPCYFQQSKFTSFQRQLSFYGFRRIVSGLDKGGYFHEQFLRGKEELAFNIQRKKIKGTGPRKPNSMESPSPNFYDMPFLPENIIKHNSNRDVHAKTVSSQTVNNTNESKEQESSMKKPEFISESDIQRKEDDQVMIWKRNQERSNQLKLLNEKHRDSYLLSRSSSNMQNYVQSGELSQAPLSNLNVGGLSLIDCLLGMRLSSSNYPFTLSATPLPTSSYSTPSLPFYIGETPSSSSTQDIIRTALTNYFQQQQKIR